MLINSYPLRESRRDRTMVELRVRVLPAAHFRPEGRPGSRLSRWYRYEIAYPDQVVRGQGEGEGPTHSEHAPVPRLSHHPDRLQPAKDLFDSLALPLANLVAGMPGGSLVDIARLVRGVPRDMRCRLLAAQARDKGRLVKTFV